MVAPNSTTIVTMGRSARLSEGEAAAGERGIAEESNRDTLPSTMLRGTLSHYRIKDRLGAGGMGEVYRVEDTRLGRDVALKLLLPEFAADPERLRRFRREAQLLAALDHPAIVTIFSVEEADGLPFLTMQLVDGSTLEQLIPTGGLPLRRFFETAVPLADAVAAAHAQGVIHRDLKPSNVMCTPDGRLKVLDFGLARPAGVSTDTATARALSQDGQVVGTLPYMSPEQISGLSLDQRTDVFSLGTLLYEMATGTRPFRADSPMALVSAILTATPRPVREMRPDFPTEISRLVEACLRKDVAERLQSASELHAALRRLADASSGVASSGGQTARPRAGSGPSIAVLPFTSLSADPEDAFFADGTAEEVINALGRLPELKVAARTSSFSFKGRQEDLRTIGEKLGVRTILEGSVRRSGKRLRITAQLVDASSGYHLWSERYDRELVDVFDIQEEIARSIAARLTATLAAGSDEVLVRQGTSDIEAFRLYTQGRALFDRRTESGMRRAVPCFQHAIERDLNYALAWAGLADTLVMLEDYGLVESGSLIPSARDAIEKALRLDPDLAEAHASLGILHTLLRDGPAAVEALERAVQLRPSYAGAHNWLAWIHMVLGNRVEALRRGERAVELNPLAPEPLSNLTLAQIGNGLADKGLRTAQRAIEIQPDFESTSFYAALALYHLGRFDEAVPILERISVTWAPNAPTGLLGLTEAARGHTGPARDHLAQLEAAGDYAASGLIHAALGEVEEAFGAFRRVTRWDYWASLSVLNFFGAVLAPLRADPRYRALPPAIRASWRVPHSENEGFKEEV
jgi:eukaryotic-like serine/threonine-protein kinase